MKVTTERTSSASWTITDQDHIEDTIAKLRDALTRMVNVSNKITSNHRHGAYITAVHIDRLYQRQCEAEKVLAELDKENDNAE